MDAKRDTPKWDQSKRDQSKRDPWGDFLRRTLLSASIAGMAVADAAAAPVVETRPGVVEPAPEVPAGTPSQGQRTA